MFEKYYKFENDRIRVLLSGDKYTIDVNGIIKTQDGNIVKPIIDNDGELCVYLNWINGYDKYKISHVVYHTYKTIHLPLSYWSLISVLYADNNKLNVHPSNLVLKLPYGLGPTHYHEYVYIPGFTQYCINKNGEVINIRNGNKLTKRINTYTGYCYYDLVSDLKERITISEHKLLGLAYLDYSNNVDLLIVNHKDGVKTNNKLENLEWITASENLDHAYENNLRNNNHKILVKNVETKEIRSYRSINKCAIDLNINFETLRGRLQATNQPIFPGLNDEYLQFKMDDDTPWREVSDIREELKNRTLSTAIVAKNIFTNKIFEYNTLSETEKDLNIGRKTISTNLKYGISKIPVLEYIFKYKNDNSDWPTYTDIELNLFKQAVDKNWIFNGRGFVVIDITNRNKNYFAKNSDVMEYLNIPMKTLYHGLSNKSTIHKKYKVKYFYNKDYTINDD